MNEFGTFCSGSPRRFFFRNDKADGFLHTGPGAFSPGQLVKEVPSGLFAKLLSKLQNQILQHDFAIPPLWRVI
ncbi:hypothetical protein [Faecousia sp.]|uniref:hypothetical protein n=1 Tax=Faecousia sp. TaxID=2952921 RepID=UPI003AB7F877